MEHRDIKAGIRHICHTGGGQRLYHPEVVKEFKRLSEAEAAEGRISPAQLETNR